MITLQPAPMRTPRPAPTGWPPPASLLRRLGAMVYDALLVLALWLLTTYLAVLALTRTPDIASDAPRVRLEHMQTVDSPWLSALLVLEACAFFAYFWIRHGRTLGMQAWRLRVQRPDGGPITLPQALVRLVIAVPALACFGLGYLWILLDRERRAWPDHASGSRIVVEERMRSRDPPQ